MRIPGSEGKSSETRSLSQYFVIDFSIFSISWMWLEGSSNVRISTVSIANENAKVLDLPEDKNPVCLVYKEKHHFFSPPRISDLARELRIYVRPGGHVPSSMSSKKEYMGVEPKIGVLYPQIIHLFIGFSIIKNHPFWGFSPYLWKHPYN